MAHHNARAQRSFALANDYDTALHIVESIRRKALTANRAARQQERDASHHNDRDNDDDTDDEAVRVQSDSDSDSDVHDYSDRDVHDDHDNNNNDSSSSSSRGCQPTEHRNRGATSMRVQCAHASPLKPTRSPTHFRRSDPSAHKSAINSALDALRIESRVELHRIPSGRNLRLKHIAQSSKEALTPLALTPRAPSGKRPSECPSTSRPSPLSSLMMKAPTVAVATCCYSPTLLRMSERTLSAECTERENTALNEVREMRVPLTSTTSAPAAATAALQRRNLRGGFAVSASATAPPKHKTNQERRCSFTISELALTEMGFARTVPPPSSSPLLSLSARSNNNNNNNNNTNNNTSASSNLSLSPSTPSTLLAFAQFLPPGDARTESLDERGEDDEKVVYQFALWKHASKRKQLPNAISTRQQQSQQQQQTQHNTEQTAAWSQQQLPVSQQARGSHDVRSRELFAVDLRLPESAESSDSERKQGAESSSLHLTPSRSPTISASRSLRSFSSPVPAPLVSWPDHL